MVAFLLGAIVGNPNPLAGVIAPKQVFFDTVLKGYQSGVRGPLEGVARNQAEWKALWQKHVSTDAQPSALPSINFGREIVVAVFLGEKPTAVMT